ncbi:hypothetical protein M9435_000663 [Picochlorum sp. BPE23]|nr:hypothetical protein M9435_000663 [Picochlorum sp. BPE23]
MATQDVQVLVQSLREIQLELQKAQSVSQQFTQQQHENEMVLKELEEAGEDAKIFKKIGPALISQDYLEATTNVKKRLELIQSEEKRLQEKMQGLSKKGMEIQAKLQQQQAAGQS